MDSPPTSPHVRMGAPSDEDTHTSMAMSVKRAENPALMSDTSFSRGANYPPHALRLALCAAHLEGLDFPSAWQKAVEVLGLPALSQKGRRKRKYGNTAALHVRFIVANEGWPFSSSSTADIIIMPNGACTKEPDLSPPPHQEVLSGIKGNDFGPGKTKEPRRLRVGEAFHVREGGISSGVQDPQSFPPGPIQRARINQRPRAHASERDPPSPHRSR